MSTPIDTDQLSVSTIETFPFRPELVESVCAVLQTHGVRVEREEKRCVLRFPQGTTKIELIPRVRETRYAVHLPDGYSLYETPNYEEGSLSVVRLASEEFPEAVQELLLREPHA